MHHHMIESYKIKFWISSVLTIPVLLLSPMFMMLIGLEGLVSFKGEQAVLVFFSSIIFFYGGWPFLTGLYSEVSNRKPGMMTLIGLAISLSYVYSIAVLLGVSGDLFFWELATLIDIMLLGHWIEMRSVMGAGKALEKLAHLLPNTVHKIGPDGQAYLAHLHEVYPGDLLLIRPGEQIPADGAVTKGRSSVNESMLTGEAMPILKEVGTQVVAGSINNEGVLTVQVSHAQDDTYLASVIRLVKQAQSSKSETQNLANRAALWLTIFAISAGFLTFSIWVSLSWENLAFALERSITVMIITCPHALGLAIPLVVSVTTTLAASNGLLIRNRTAFEQAGSIQSIVFDKTGTLTKGVFSVTDLVVLNDQYKKEDILTYASSLEQNSEHPIAKAIASATQEAKSVTEFKSIPGIGAQGIIDDKIIKVVSPGYLQENGFDKQLHQLDSLFQQGKTIIFIVINDEVSGAIALADTIKPESFEAITQLKKMGIHCVMLTGDNKYVAKWVASELGIDEYIAEVLPGAKAIRVRDIQNRGTSVAMVGDGINDAPALTQADVGIAVAQGSDIAIESADIVLAKSNPLDVVRLITLSRASYRKMMQNLIWATGYNIIAIPLAAGALYQIGITLSPAVGAILMSSSTLICAINAKLLKI